MKRMLPAHLLRETHVGKATPFSIVLPLKTFATALHRLICFSKIDMTIEECQKHMAIALNRHQKTGMPTVKASSVGAYSSMKLSPFVHRSRILAPLLAALITAARAPAMDTNGKLAQAG